MLLLFVACFQITEPFHPEFTMDADPDYDNTHYLQLGAQQELRFETSQSQSWIEDLARSTNDWAVSVALPNGLPSSGDSEAISLLHTNRFSLALNLQECTLYLQESSSEPISILAQRLPEDSCQNAPNPNGRVHENSRLSIHFKPQDDALLVELFINVNSLGSASFNISDAPEATFVSFGGRFDNAVDFTSAALGLDQLIFCNQEGASFLNELREAQYFANNQELHSVLGSGCYFFPLGELEEVPNVNDFTQRYVGNVTGPTTEDNEFALLDQVIED